MPSCGWEALKSLLKEVPGGFDQCSGLLGSWNLEHGPSWEHPQKTPREELVQLITKPNCCVSGLCASTPHTSAHPGAAWADCNYINYAGRAAAGQEGGAPSPWLFLFPGAVVRQAVGTSWDREVCVGVPICRAARTTWFTGEEMTETVAKAGQRDFLLDSLGTIQNWLLSDCGSGELLFSVLVHPSSYPLPLRPWMNL